MPQTINGSIPIRCRRKIPTYTITLLSVAALAFAITLFEPNPIPAAVFCGLTLGALYILIIQPRPLSATLGAEEIHLDGLPRPIPYSEIDGLTLNGIPHLSTSVLKPGRVEINHPGGTIVIGENASPKSHKIFTHILHKLAPVSRPDLLPAALRGFYSEQAEKFGAERVWAFGARSFSPKNFLGVRTLHYGVSFLIISSVSILSASILGANTHHLAPFSIGAGSVGIIALLIGWVALLRTRSNAKKRTFGLVVAPQGIALSQGGVAGQQAWDALSGISYLNRGPRTGIKLLIPGTTLIIADVFSSPLQMIEGVIGAYLGR